MVGKIHPDLLRKFFGWFVLGMAVFILSQQIGATVIDFASGSTLNLIEVIIAILVVIALFTWIIRRPAKIPLADYDEPEIALKAKLDE
jgi:uncharacterized membrane protein